MNNKILSALEMTSNLPPSTTGGISVFIVFAILILSCSAVKYQEVLDHIAERRDELSKHPFFEFLADESIAPERRMQFAPYWTFLALTAPDIFDHSVWYESPRNALEERINEYIMEDDFHYNLFFHDVEEVLGYTLERYGSFEGVVRHLWSGETRALRQLMYHLAILAATYRDDPTVILTVFEAGEAALAKLFATTYESVYLGDGGLKGLKYFGKEHRDLEMSHNVTTSGFAGERTEDTEITEESVAGAESTEESLVAGTEITDDEWARHIGVVDGLFSRFIAVYDELYALDVAEDSIYPEKFRVEGYPELRNFPAKPRLPVKDSSKEEL